VKETYPEWRGHMEGILEDTSGTLALDARLVYGIADDPTCQSSHAEVRLCRQANGCILKSMTESCP
jgi:hypothetical protein